ncbi:MAG: cell division ATP-binding protein FtsE [Deltaproteobacteria bacterium]|nr:cell division ATP-binding protein FtsE [Deltaproteobacteria bacterium]MCL5277599.1 cell division ATP-binding protein FtsE [Deltaproteobacteria bacterium]
MIQLFHVYKHYMKGSAALEDISLQIEKGEFAFITGPSGAGKSTLLKLMFLAEMPTKGQIIINGYNITRLKKSAVPFLRRNIGVVFQDFKLLYDRTVFDNVALSLSVLGMPRKEIKKKVWEMLKLVGLQHKLNFYPLRLSGGEQQRVSIARALVSEPAILLADEPTGNLDPDLTLDVMKLFEDVNIKGTTVVVATHDKNLITRYTRRVIVLEHGRIMEKQ